MWSINNPTDVLDLLLRNERWNLMCYHLSEKIIRVFYNAVLSAENVKWYEIVYWAKD